MSTGTKTNIIAAISLLIVVGALGAVFLDKITWPTFAYTLIGVGVFGGIKVAFFTKSHSDENNISSRDVGGEIPKDDDE